MSDNYMADLARSEAGLPPETISFTADDIDGAYDDPDEAREVMMHAMDKDMREKYGVCDFCNGTLQQTGSCFTCGSCGETTGCS